MRRVAVQALSLCVLALSLQHVAVPPPAVASAAGTPAPEATLDAGEPAGEPAEEPTAAPTEEPAGEPAEEPAAAPTEEPAGEPAGEPAAAPTEEPAGLEELQVELQEAGELRVGRVAGEDRVTTAVEVSRSAFESSDAVVVASAGSFPDALAAAPLAAALDAPLLLTGPRLPAVVAEEIRRLGASEAVVVGAVGAVPLVVQEELRAVGVEVRRVAGETRFDTAALLGREVGTSGGEVLLASGNAFPDALSAAPLAAVEGLPILLSASSSLVDDTAEALAALASERVLVVGGQAAISPAVTAQLPDHRRLAGPERYATSVAVAEELLRRGGTLDDVFVATGRDFPDALSAGPAAARSGGPVLLVDGLQPSGSRSSLEFVGARGADIGSLWVLGGTAAVSEATVEALVRARGGP